MLLDRIDADATLGQIFHISLSAVKMKNPRASGGTTFTVAHLPVSHETLEQSLTNRIGTAPVNADYLDATANGGAPSIKARPISSASAWQRS